MATRTYYAYNVPAGMKNTDFETMIDEETNGTAHVTDVSIQDDETVLTFEEPGSLTVLCYFQCRLVNDRHQSRI